MLTNFYICLEFMYLFRSFDWKVYIHTFFFSTSALKCDSKSEKLILEFQNYHNNNNYYCLQLQTTLTKYLHISISYTQKCTNCLSDACKNKLKGFACLKVIGMDKLKTKKVKGKLILQFAAYKLLRTGLI